MKQVTITIAFIVATTIGIAQGNSYRIITDITPESYPLIIENIKEVAGIHTHFIVKEDKVDNIEATMIRRKKYILYNPHFMEEINYASKDKWATIALLAHEIGHHVKGHTSKKPKKGRLQCELEADEFAGYVLRKLGATLEQAQIVMKFIARSKPSGTHPARKDRMEAIQKGWNAASSVSRNHEEVSARIP